MTIHSTSFFEFNAKRVPSPCFVIDQAAVERNLRILQQVQRASGAKILLALKAFSLFALAPLITRYLQGCCASGLHEARLAYEKFAGDQPGGDKREVHVCSPAYSAAELEQLCDLADHLVFNSWSQWRRFQQTVRQARKKRPRLRCGLRINPMVSLVATEAYDPCAPCSRLGIPVEEFRRHIQEPKALADISGLHFHTLCEQGFAPLEQTLEAIEQQFGDYLPHLDWLNLGGGHHITDGQYDTAALIKKISALQQKYQLQIYLEPGEAIAIHTGVLVSEVLDLPWNTMNLAIMDTSATCHMPDTLEMPYRADILLNRTDQPNGVAGKKGEKPHTYRLGGQTCLAGDIMGDYSFDKPLAVGQRLMFDDMAHYTMVKTTTFNGIPLPAIAIWNSDNDELNIIKQFGYQDFLHRLS